MHKKQLTTAQFILGTVTSAIVFAGIRSLLPDSWIEEYDGALTNAGLGILIFATVGWAMMMVAVFSTDQESHDKTE